MYVIVRTVESAAAVNAPASIDRQAVRQLLGVRPELLIDGRRPSQVALADRLAALWLSDEPVIDVGLASRSLHTRVGQFYRTRLGVRSPHGGGWPVMPSRSRSNLGALRRMR